MFFTFGSEILRKGPQKDQTHCVFIVYLLVCLLAPLCCFHRSVFGSRYDNDVFAMAKRSTVSTSVQNLHATLKHKPKDLWHFLRRFRALWILCCVKIKNNTSSVPMVRPRCFAWTRLRFVFSLDRSPCTFCSVQWSGLQKWIRYCVCVTALIILDHCMNQLIPGHEGWETICSCTETRTTSRDSNNTLQAWSSMITANTGRWMCSCLCWW